MSTIVVLDDLRTSRSILTQLAFTVEKDVRVEAFARPDEALEWVRDHTPDLVVTDYEMPGMDGSEFISRFRALHSCSDVPVIVVTVHEDPEFRHKALQVGATDFLLSPVDHEEFRARSQNLLSLRAHHRLTQLRADDLAKAVATSDRRLQDALRENHAQLEKTGEFSRHGRCPKICGAGLSTCFCRFVFCECTLKTEVVNLFC